MKTKYQRMNRKEKKELIERYKKDKSKIYKKIRNMIIICYIGIVYSFIAITYDFYFKKGILNYVLDSIVLIVSIVVLLIVMNTRKNLLSDYAVK